MTFFAQFLTILSQSAKEVSFGMYSDIKHASIVCTLIDNLIIKNLSAKQIKKEVALLNDYLFVKKPEFFK